MRWFRRRNPMRTWEFTFEGETTGRRRTIIDCSNSYTQSKHDVQRCLNNRYHEEHELLWWQEIEGQQKS